ncbi:paternally-expressed gene 3 protein isoform X3 [Myotis daubentonii]|uniref:paternally-expressed gene 3 protein isoform X3 n=1 Tax=Myotis daubentonii TaxID=98922 RepID=UPI002873C6BE|nr:paternally-expressed gene 3 protein isoform X3 [Myotis daubentonii]
MRARNVCHTSFGSSSDYSAKDTMSYQDMVKLTEDRKAQNSIKDNMENYRKLLFLGLQLAEDDGHSHMTQGHSRSKRSAYPSTSRGLRTMPEAKKSTHRRGICEEEASHGAIMEKFKDVLQNPTSARPRVPSDRFPRVPRRADHDWKEVSLDRESVIQEGGCAGNACRGACNCNSNLVSKKKVLERKRRYEFDTDGKGSAHDQRDSPRKKPFEGGEMRRAMSMSSLSPPSAESQPLDFAAMPYVCDECGRAFSVISEFVEHQIMHTRENLYEYGEAFLRSVAVTRKSAARGKCFECKECGETFDKTVDLAEHCQIHSRGHLTECNDEEYEEPFMPSPTFSELQKMYGKEKFYECKVCKETFLHSSALVEHQKKIHGRDDKDDEVFKPNPAFKGLQRMHAKEKMYECNVCGETFRHSSSLKEHQKIHTRANLFENKSKACEETFIPGQPLRRRQKYYLQEKLYSFKDDGDAFGQKFLFPSEHPSVHFQKNSYEGRAYGKSVIHSRPFTESRKSHTITRPPENEDEKAFTISSNPDDNQKITTKENVLEKKPNERSVIHSLSLAEVQKCHSAVGPNKPKVIAESTITSPNIPEQKVHAGEKTSEEKKNERSVIHSLPVFKLPKSPSGNEWNEKGGFSNLHAKQQKPPARPTPNEGDKSNNYKDSVIRRVSGTEPPKSLAAEGASEFKKDGQSTVSKSNVPEHQKARAKKKNIERRNCETSVIHSLHFGEPETFLPREKLYECPECGESFVRSSDLTEHQKIHHRKKPFGSKNYERSVIRSVASADPQTSYAEQPVQVRYGQEPEGMTCIQQPEQASFLDELVEMSYVKEPVQGYGQEPVGMTCLQEPEGMTCLQEPEEMTCLQEPIQTSFFEDLVEMNYVEEPVQGYGQEPVGMICIQQPAQASHPRQPVGVSSAGQPAQASHPRQPVGMSSAGQPAQASHPRQPVGMSSAGQLAQASHPRQPVGVSYAGQPAQASCAQHPVPQECKDCGQSFATIEDLGAHQKIYTQEKFHGGSVIRGAVGGRPEQEEPEPEEEEEEEDSEDSIYGCKDCGLGFADRADLKDHQKVHGREYLVDTREYTQSVIHTHSISEYQRDNTGEQLFECPACGESFVHSSFLFEHQKVHEQDPYYGHRRYDEPFMNPFILNPQRFRAPQANPTAMYLQCHVCGQDFIHGSVFNEHLALHMGEGSPEQAQRSSDAVSAGLALAELQRSQAEEKHYECGICGEAFLSQADLREHKKIHEKDDEPYDYGASFVHTSFLTEPPKGDSPFFECKDCGKSFIHNTVLTKHQKFHVEEEEAAAQEVEANVLVPREVLRIQGSNMEAAEPEVEAAEPEVEAAEPNVEAAEPNGEAEGPDGEAAEPNGEAEQPNGEAEQPNGDADEPDGAGIEDPEERDEELEGKAEEPEGKAEELEGKAEEPEGDADEPDGAGIEDPEEEDEDEEIQVEEPYYDCRECGETFTTTSAYGEHRQTHARVIIFESGNVYGEGSHYTGQASTSTQGSDRAEDKYFKCDVCGQFFCDRLSLARHQNTHTG